MEESAGPSNVSLDALQALLTRIGATWTDLSAVLDALPEERRTEERGGRRLVGQGHRVGHLGYWTGEVVASAERRLAGKHREEPDWQVVNDPEAAKRAEVPFEEVRRGSWEENHARLVALLGELQPDHPAAAEIVESAEHEAVEHYGEHLAEIRAWWTRTGG